MKHSAWVFFRKYALVFTLAMAGLPPDLANAQLVFTFTEDGGDVIMTPSGSIDVSQLVPAPTFGGFGSFGIEVHSSPESDIIGDNCCAGGTSYAFNTGTDFSAWVDDPGPLSQSHFGVGPGLWTTTTVTTNFATYIPGALRQPGLAISAGDLVGNIWTPDGGWVASGQTFTSLGLNPGTYTITDAVTGASITIQIGAPSTPTPPEPSGPSEIPTLGTWWLLLLAGLLGMGAVMVRRHSVS